MADSPKRGKRLFTPLRAAVEERVTFQKLPEIVPAALGDTAGCLGAGLLAWDLARHDQPHAGQAGPDSRHRPPTPRASGADTPNHSDHPDSRHSALQ